jgi:glycerol-3-phosphate dehydrogenase subunit C
VRWLARHQPLAEAGDRGTVALFATCLGDYNFPRIAASAVRVLERNGWSVVRPEQTCCGKPNLDGGNVAAARAKAQANVLSLAREVDQGRTIVTIQPTCRAMARQEWPILESTEQARRVSAAVIDIMELLDQHRRDKSLYREFSKGFGKVAYHASCHLRAEKIGYPGVRVLSVIPDTLVEVVEHCSAVDGTWGMKAQHYEMGEHYARKLMRGIDALEPALVVSDCALAACRIRGSTQRSPLHPVEALAEAYGIAPDVR